MEGDDGDVTGFLANNKVDGDNMTVFRRVEALMDETRSSGKA